MKPHLPMKVVKLFEMLRSWTLTALKCKCIYNISGHGTYLNNEKHGNWVEIEMNKQNC
jgi:hypothetical protein